MVNTVISDLERRHRKEGITRPVVSIGLPTFNRSKSLGLAIDSILAQDLRDFELVISDNASSDSTESICRKYCRRDDRIRYIRQPANRGASTNFQTVLLESSGEYFMWLSDDDWLDPAYLSRCVGELSGNAELALVCGLAKYVDEHGREYPGIAMNLLQDSACERVLRFYGKVNDNGTFYGVARREMLVSNPMPEVLGGDWLLVATLALLGKVRTLEDVFIHRSRVGISADVRSLARALGMSDSAARQPHRAIAVTIAKDIAYRSRAFTRLGFTKRWLLAVRSARAIHRRFVVSNHPLDSWPMRTYTRLTRKIRIN
jgi:glycosyltransferase involved in cell wall biosynthesis